MRLTVPHLDAITATAAWPGRKQALCRRLEQYGGPINDRPVLAQCLAQMMHESGGLRYVREIWGPTKAQLRYEGRLDLGNTLPGDGKKFLGRDPINITGRLHYHNFTAWARRQIVNAPDFEARPELLESEEWLGLGTVWYLLTRDGLLDYARDGNIEMVTWRVNGGLNGYPDRLLWYQRSSLVLLGYGRGDVSVFQRRAGLVADGICGPMTRAALHRELGR